MRLMDTTVEWGNRVAIWGGGLLFAMFCAWIINLVILTMTNTDRPLIILDRPHQESIVQRGSALHIRTTLIRDTDCTGLTERWMRRALASQSHD